MMTRLRNRRWWFWVGLAALPIWGAGQAVRRMYAPHYPDMAVHAGLALVARPRRVLAIAAHPGELEFHAGGTLSLMAQSGSTITAAVMTTGEAAAQSRKNLMEVRTREQQQAAAILGYDRLVQIGLPDEGLTEHPRLAPAVQQLWDETQPDLVLAPDPRGLIPMASPDSAATGYAAMHAALGRLIPGEGPGPAMPQRPDSPTALIGRAALLVAREKVKEEPQLLLYGSRRPNVLVDVTDLQEKVQAVKSHRSQLRGPDRMAENVVRGLSRVFRQDTASYYVEGFYRVL